MEKAVEEDTVEEAVEETAGVSVENVEEAVEDTIDKAVENPLETGKQRGVEQPPIGVFLRRNGQPDGHSSQ